MKRNECGTEEDLLPYYALFGLPRKLRTLEKTLENNPKLVAGYQDGLLL